MTQSSRRSEEEWKDEILDYLLDNPSGVTITDISNGLNTSRITAGKYVGILEAEKRILNKKIGAYKLYFSAERGLIPKKVMLSYYTGLLEGIKDEIKDSETFKTIGKKIAKYMGFPYGSAYPDSVMPNRKGSIEKFLKYFGKTFSYIDFIYERRPKVKTTQSGNTAKYYLTEIELFDMSEDYDVHFYIASGVIEVIVSNSLKRQVECKIEDVNVKERSVIFSLNIL